ncbi:Crp/Fnr family transcriptional regulator [Spirosoma sp. HMF3257]|uniref:Crp/Fnr family transcriptional regulator n=1 Tax=Spirosoma telluris TaxID=2183553 RepID=A0A327NEF9_9BACT|nr:Crp/Fnr family transcriptional regulator [Spirosoma telluris]RAI73522.1 Crp/Fnr family transcriptional regulator [Spirosoma telluris]
MELTAYLKQIVGISPELEYEIDQSFAREVFPKRHKLLLPDNLSQKVYFFEQGLARAYYIRHDGKDITHHFFLTNSFSMAIENIFYGRPAPYGLELLEKSVVRSINYADLEKIIDRHHNLEKVMRTLLIEILKTFSDRLNALQFQSAQERYANLLAQYPSILQQVPLGHIASYLGITQQTLSVIRAQR